ncbi:MULTISPECIES: PfkB family carbohydrate kinase [unclassified Massilia]|uniref:PfkB family carbohydrate kinase n=1 Tax=unclassified Massilia TaxID=2609279 RepID=UPI001B835E12|nr:MULTISPECIES: PfkB family carbohydrate kinase [unclassified Massilia]MBQ5941599.1 fructokinase [Massilia sp. AB1]MBQ5961558.1 fructokinase [Massilia sp. ZL223]
MAAPVTVVFGEALVDDFSTEQVVGGAPFNVARHLAAFMAPQLMVTRIGNDRLGQLVRAEFERFAMSEAGLQVDAMEETGRVLVERGARGGHRFTILPNQAYDFIDRQQAVAAVESAQPGILYFGTLAQRNEHSRATLTAVLEASPALRFLDLNLRDGQVEERCVTRSLQAAHVAKVNEEELQALFQWYFQIRPEDPPLSAEEVHASCQALLQMFSLDALIVTLGHRGSVYFGSDGQVINHRDNPAPPFVIDTVGAGDAFSAIFLLGKMRGWELEQTLARANEFAGAICAVPGAVPRDLGFYDKWMTRWR